MGQSGANGGSAVGPQGERKAAFAPQIDSRDTYLIGDDGTNPPAANAPSWASTTTQDYLSDVMQNGSDNEIFSAGGGGGGTFVMRAPTNNTRAYFSDHKDNITINHLLIAAGGGGGAPAYWQRTYWGIGSERSPSMAMTSMVRANARGYTTNRNYPNSEATPTEDLGEWAVGVGACGRCVARAAAPHSRIVVGEGGRLAA